MPFEANPDQAAMSAQHFLQDHADDRLASMISVVGGSLSMAAAVARDCARKVGIRVAEPKGLAAVDPGTLNPLFEQWVVEVAEAGRISEESAGTIVEWHGKRSEDIAHMAMSSLELRTPLCPPSQHIVAEALDADLNECAVTLGDVLLRRLPVALGPCWSDACSREAALRIGVMLGWNEEISSANLEALEMERAAYLKRPRMGTRLGTVAD